MIRIERDILLSRLVLIVLELCFVDVLPLLIIVPDDLLRRGPVEISILIVIVLNPLLLDLP